MFCFEKSVVDVSENRLQEKCRDDDRAENCVRLPILGDVLCQRTVQMKVFLSYLALTISRISASWTPIDSPAIMQIHPIN